MIVNCILPDGSSIDERTVSTSAIKEFGAVGFGHESVHSKSELDFQALEIDYDSSCFDVDPFQAAAGGVGKIWPVYCLEALLSWAYTHTTRPYLIRCQFRAGRANLDREIGLHRPATGNGTDADSS